jgi:hypothetical protein
VETRKEQWNCSFCADDDTNKVLGSQKKAAGLAAFFISFINIFAKTGK